MKMRNAIFGFLFSAIIVGVCSYVIFIKPPTYYSAMELKKNTTFIKPTFMNVKDGFFQSTFEEAMSDQFVKKLWFNQIYYKLDYYLYNLSKINDKDFTLVKVGKDSYTFNVSDGYLTSFPYILSKSSLDPTKGFADSVNALAEKYNDKHFYVYLPFRLNESNWFDADNGFISGGTIYRENLKNNLSSKVIFNDNVPNSFEEYKELYYKTDPHWNHKGSYEGYLDLLDSFSTYYNDTEPQIPVNEYCFSDFEFYGQFGRDSAYLTDYDRFCTFDFEFKDYTTVVNGEQRMYSNMEKYRNFEMEEFYWDFIYSNYYGNDEAEVIFNFDTNKGRSLLAFVDSYSSPVKYLIATEFDTTYFIDPRINWDFEIEAYLEAHPDITDILYLGFSGSLYNNERYHFTINEK